MTKRLFSLILAAAVTTASCSTDELTDVSHAEAITFRAAVQTRAESTTTANLEEFFVTAFKHKDGKEELYFSDLKFKKEGTAFVSEKIYFWPDDGSSLRFFAYTPSTGELGAEMIFSDAEKKLADFSPAADIAQQKDFCHAYAQVSRDQAAGGVQLTFGHNLSQIEVQAKNTNDAYVYKVRGVRIAEAVSKGSYELDNMCWLPAEDKASYTVQYAEAITLNAEPQSIMGQGGGAMLIPQKLTAWDATGDRTNAKRGAYLAVLVSVATRDGFQLYPKVAGQYAWTAVPVETEWVNGKKYIYTLDFSDGAGMLPPDNLERPGTAIMGGPLSFQVSTGEWQDGGSADLPME